MKIAIYGRLTDRTDFKVLHEFFAFLRAQRIGYLVHAPYALELEPRLDSWREHVAPCILEDGAQLKGIDFAYSFGGDGTFLNTVQNVNGKIPVLGVNFGRLGFLTTIMQDQLIHATVALTKDMYRIDLRSALVVESDPPGLFGPHGLGLNDLTIHKTQSNEMITVHTYLNGEYLNSYWADGLIIATPTGSTAYSLSCGGPVIHPGSNAFVITPVAPHSLTVRPMVIPDDYILSFGIESRTGKAMIALDTRTIEVENKTEIAVRKSPEPVKLVRVASSNHLENLRSRLMWGRDHRN
jgi:NAD+ kinase